jgi:hypothetical protein
MFVYAGISSIFDYRLGWGPLCVSWFIFAQQFYTGVTDTLRVKISPQLGNTTLGNYEPDTPPQPKLVPASATKHSAPMTHAASQPGPPQQPQVAHSPAILPAEIVTISKQAADGVPTTISRYGSDEGLFMARLRANSAYAATTNGLYSVVGVRDSAGKDFMIIWTGSESEHAACRAAGASGGALDKLNQTILTKEERQMLRPVGASSNFAMPGCYLESLDGFNQSMEKLRSGRYSVVTASAK